MKNLLRGIIAILAIVFLDSCTKTVEPAPNFPVASYDNSVMLEWNKLYLTIDRVAPGYRPGPSPRALGYLGYAVYEACIGGLPGYQSLSKKYPDLKLTKLDPNQEYHWPSVINTVYGTMMQHLFPEELIGVAPFATIIAKENELKAKYEAGNDPSLIQRSILWGQQVAKDMIAWEKSDPYGYQAYLDPAMKKFGTYVPSGKAGDWAPTPPDYTTGRFPHWGKVRTFAISEDDKKIYPPLPYSNVPGSLFRNQAEEVMAYCPTDKSKMTYENQWIAEFWSDDETFKVFSPPARWIAIANQVIEDENVNLEKAIIVFAKIGMALNDAGVSCWFSKYYYNVERPVSFIRREIDPNWDVWYLNFTPGFPAYPSGHSTFGAAGAEVLTAEFGPSFAMTDKCHLGRSEFKSTPRSFNSFYEMAEENAFSRIPLGVHYSMDAESGLDLGYRCGRRVEEMNWKK